MIAGRNHQVSPPLVRHFMGLQQLGIKSLFGALAQRRRKLAGIDIGQRGKVNQAGKALAEATRDGRNGEIADRAGAEFLGHKIERVQQVSGEFIHARGGIGRARRRPAYSERLAACMPPGKRIVRGWHSRKNGFGRESAFKLVIRVQLDSVSIVLLNHGLEVAEVEAGESDRSVRLQVRDAPLSVHVVFHWCSGGGHGQVLRIAEGQVVIGQAGAGSRIPGAARADIVNLIARIANYGALRDGFRSRAGLAGSSAGSQTSRNWRSSLAWIRSERSDARSNTSAGFPSTVAAVTRMLGDRLKGKARSRRAVAR